MPQAVSLPEGQLISLARVAVGAAPLGSVRKLLCSRTSVPRQISATACRLLGDTLSKGVVYSLARHGGFELFDNKRLWERVEPPQLHFSAHLIQFFWWMLAVPLAETQQPQLTLNSMPSASHPPWTLAEELILVLLFEALKDSEFEPALARLEILWASPLMVLTHAAHIRVSDFSRIDLELDVTAYKIALEGFRHLMARSWARAELAKQDIESCDTMVRIGTLQAAAIDAFLSKLQTPKDRALASFLVEAAAIVLKRDISASTFVQSLSPNTTVRARSEARKMATPLLRSLSRLKTWDAEHRNLRFFEDDYTLAQELAREWQVLGERSFAAAEQIIAELDSIGVSRPDGSTQV